MKKSQVEMFGFAIIIILVIIGIFLLISFRLMSDKEMPVNKEEDFAMSFVSVFTQIDVDCGAGQEPMLELIQECALGEANPGCSPCQAMNDAARTILNETIARRGVPHYFVISARNTNLTEFSLNCNESMQHYAPASQPVGLFDDGFLVDTLSVSLTICR